METSLSPVTTAMPTRGRTWAEFKIDFEDGSSATFCLADPGSSVAVRDENDAVEYLG
jgi:hypothetical protein